MKEARLCRSGSVAPRHGRTLTLHALLDAHPPSTFV